MRDDMPKFELGYSDVAAFDDAVAELPEDTFVFMANEFGGGKAQIPMRTYHGRWSYVVYEPSAFDLVARHLDDEGVRSFYVEQRLLDLLDDAGLACQVDSGSDPVAVPVRFGGNTAEDLVELVPVNGCEPTPASRPEAAGAS
jgi:hypothetical protein